MQKRRQAGKRLTALILCMAMVLTSLNLWSPALTAEAASVETEQVERGERKMKFNDNWKFKLVNKYDINDNSVQAEGTEYDDSQWDAVELPHDWAIYQEYENSNGVRAAQGALPGGVGWYRKSFTLSDEFKNKTVSLQFDGVYMISQVWVNGHTMDDWKQYLGYTTFTYDITDYLNFDGQENVIAVKVQSSNSSARWYAGAGIYRNVWLISTEKMHIPVNGVTVTTPLEKVKPAVADGYTEIKDPTAAGVDIKTEITNDSETANTVTLKSTIYDKEGDVKSVETTDVRVAAGGTETVEQSIEVPNPKLWSTDSPNLYWVRTEVLSGEKVLDTEDTRFGIRYIALNPNSGFYLNGVRTQLNGVCEHSDLGALGMEVYQAAIDRRIRKLKSFGCNAVRTAHNPVSPEYIEACDRLGMLVFEEAFDQWLNSKNSEDYSHYFNKASDGTTEVFQKTSDDSSIEIKREDLTSNAERDIKAMVNRDKNSPAVFAWSTGNEIDDACYGHGMDTLEMLTGWIKEIDTVRPVAACPPTWYGYWAWSQQEQHLAAADFSGYNYGQGWYDGAHERYPDMCIFGSETVSAFYTRGVYTVGGQRTPSEYPLAYNFSTASYSLEMHRDKTYTAGEFVWTGHDYLGEPTPQGWPSKSSYFGIVDTAGFEKDAFYLYKSMWTEIPTVHLLPQNWNYKTGDRVPVYIYTNASSVELFLNGESLGVRNFDKATASPVYVEWGNVEYQPGELKVVARDGENGTGNVIATDVVYTADKAQNVELSADRAYIKNDGRDLVFVEATITDSAGNMVPDADNEITFTAEGGEIVAVDNGNPEDLNPYRGVNTRNAFSGKALVIVKAIEGSVGNIRITATAGSAGGTLSSNVVNVETRNELPGDGTGTPEFLNTEVILGKGVDAEAVLPETVQMLYSNGLIENFPVTSWNLTGLDSNTPGIYQVTGTAEGMEKEFTCTITVKDVKAVEEVNVTTLANVAPPLPKFVTITYADDTIGAAPVTWEAVSEDEYASKGTFDVTGSIGPELTVTAHVAVKEVESVDEITLTTVVGTMPEFPSGVDVTFTDGTTENIGVDWEIEQEDVEAAGIVEITGKILGSEIKAVANVHVKSMVYASDLEWTKTEGTVAKDETVGKNKLNARVDQGGPPTGYSKGLGTLADAEVEYDISGKGYESFQSYITLGFDYGQGALGAVRFKVYVDEETEPRYTSPVMTHASKNIPIDVDVKGASKVRLVTETAVPEGGTAAEAKYNLADWCDARFVSENLTVDEVLRDESCFVYNDLGKLPELFDTVEVQVDSTSTAKFHVKWPELTADMFDTAKLTVMEGEVTGTDGKKVTAKVITDLPNAVLDPEVRRQIGSYSIKESFAYVENLDAKVKLSAIEDLTEKSPVIYKWSSNLLIENCQKYGFNYGVYPDPNDANPEYLIVRAPAMKKFVLRGTANDSSIANQSFTFYTSNDGKNWTKFTDYNKTEDNSRDGWPSRLYTGENLPDMTNYLKIAFPTGNTWKFNLNELQIDGEAAVQEDVYTVGLNANGGSLPADAQKMLSVTPGEAVGELPVPTRNRYTFKGWFTESKGGEEVTSAYVPETSTVLYAQWEKIPVNQEDTVIYFVDSGASAFTEEGQAYVEEYADTIRNRVPDKAYEEKSGWGYTNSDADVEASQSGDAYSTIRNFKAGHNGLTLSYKFALEAGTYDVITGFCDPWSQYANGDRRAQITAEDGEGNVLAEKAAHTISGSRETVTLTDVKLAADGSLSLNLKPLVSNPDNLDSCDMLISFIVIIKKANPDAPVEYTVTFDAGDGSQAVSQKVNEGEKAVRPEEPVREGYLFDGWFRDEACTQAWDFDADTVTEDITLYAGWTQEVPDADEKKGLKAAIDLAKALKAEDYTKETYEVLANAIEAANAVYQAEGQSAEQIQEQLDSLAAAVAGLKTALADENAGLADELEKTQQEILEKLQEIAVQNEKAERLEKELAAANTRTDVLKNGDSVTVKGVKYRVTDAEKKEAQAYGTENKKLLTISVAASVKIKGETCKVVSIADKAFAGCKKVKKAVIGKNVTVIGKKAFYGDKSLKNITVKANKLKTAGKQALKGISPKAVIKVPKAKKKAYTKLFKGKGQKATVKVK